VHACALACETQGTSAFMSMDGSHTGMAASILTGERSLGSLGAGRCQATLPRWECPGPGRFCTAGRSPANSPTDESQTSSVERLTTGAADGLAGTYLLAYYVLMQAASWLQLAMCMSTAC